jgi:hypothetical protein
MMMPPPMPMPLPVSYAYLGPCPLALYSKLNHALIQRINARNNTRGHVPLAGGCRNTDK